MGLHCPEQVWGEASHRLQQIHTLYTALDLLAPHKLLCDSVRMFESTFTCQWWQTFQAAALP
jgi:hypothetical protein